MKKALCIYIIMCVSALMAFAQERRVQNRPYTDLRPMHFGIVVGAGLQDLELTNVGEQTLTYADGTADGTHLITCEQKDWEMGFNVGVLLETRLNEYFAFRSAAQLYFGTRNLVFHNFKEKDEYGGAMEKRQAMKTVYVGANLDLIYAAQRFNNHRPYIMAGLAPMMNLNPGSNNYVQLKPYDVFFEIGLGCDFYMPFFKLRPELKFMLGLTNSLNTSNIKNLRDKAMLPYAASVSSATSRIISLSFYFE